MPTIGGIAGRSSPSRLATWNPMSRRASHLRLGGLESIAEDQAMSKSAPLIRRLISVKEAAYYIGLSPDTVYTMVSQRRIPFVKMGRRTMFDLAALDGWIKQNTVMPMPPKTP